MALSLTCDCGARFEVEDTLAGQEVSCPECGQPLKAPALQASPVQTSALAIASAVLALAGAFTVVGTLAAVVLGALALVSIARHRDRLAGAGLAVFGIVAGCVLTPLMVLALTTSELFGLGGWLREKTMADQIDTSGPLEIVEAAQGFAITRPSEKWGQATGHALDDPVLAGLQKDRDLLLVQPARNAFVDVRVVRNSKGLTVDSCQPEVLRELESVPDNPFQEWDEEDVPQPRRPGRPGRASTAQVETSRDIPALDGAAGREMVVDIHRAGQAWRFLVRFYKKPGRPLYITRAYTQKRNFRRVEGELRQALDSFRLLPR
jgi:hypothetical protein